MKWLLVMLLVCMSTTAALLWRLIPPASPLGSPAREKNSRVAFEQPQPPLIPAVEAQIAMPAVDEPRAFRADVAIPNSTEVHWAQSDPVKLSPSSSATQQPRVRNALDNLEDLAARVAADAGNLDLRFALATRQMSLRLWTLAIPELEKVVAGRPGDLEAHFNLAIACQGAARLADARRAWDRVLALDPQQIEARGYRAEILLDLGEYELAAADLEFVSVSRPADDATKLNLAVALQGAGKLTAAVEIVNQLLSDRPQHLSALKRAAALSAALCHADPANAAEHRERAIDFARRAAAIAPQDQPIAQLLLDMQNHSP